MFLFFGAFSFTFDMAERIFQDDPLDIKKEIEQELLQLEKTFDSKLELLKTINGGTPDFEIVEEPPPINVPKNCRATLDVASGRLEHVEDEEVIAVKNFPNVSVKSEHCQDSFDTTSCKLEEAEIDEGLQILSSVITKTEPITPVRETLNVKICEEDLDELRLRTLKNELFSDVDLITENKDKSTNNRLNNDASEKLSCIEPIVIETLTENRNENSYICFTNSKSKINHSNTDQFEDQVIIFKKKSGFKKIETPSYHDKPLGVLLNLVDSKWKSGNSLSKVNTIKVTNNSRKKSNPKGNGNRNKAKYNLALKNTRGNSASENASIKHTVLLSCPNKKKVSSKSDVSANSSALCKNKLVNDTISEPCSNEYAPSITRKRRHNLRNLGNDSDYEFNPDLEVNRKKIKTGSKSSSVTKKERPAKNKVEINKSDVCIARPHGDQVSSDRGLETESKIKSVNKKNCVIEKHVSSDEKCAINETRLNVNRVKHGTSLASKQKLNGNIVDSEYIVQTSESQTVNKKSKVNSKKGYPSNSQSCLRNSKGKFVSKKSFKKNEVIKCNVKQNLNSIVTKPGNEILQSPDRSKSDSRKKVKNLSESVDHLEPSRQDCVNQINTETPHDNYSAKKSNDNRSSRKKIYNKVIDSDSLNSLPDKVICMQQKNNPLRSDFEPSRALREDKHDSNQKFENSAYTSSFGHEQCKKTIKLPLKSDIKRKKTPLADKTSNTKTKSGSDNKSEDQVSEPSSIENIDSVKTVTDSKNNQKVMEKIIKCDSAAKDSLVCERIQEKTTSLHEGSSSNQHKSSENQQDDEIFSSSRIRSKYKVKCPVLAYLCICGAWCKSGEDLSKHICKCQKLQPRVVLYRI